MRSILTYCVIAFAVLLCGCAQVKPQPDYDRANEHIQDATGYAPGYRPSEELLASQQVELLMHDGLSLDDAVKLALLNNPTLQATYRDVGIARADVVQSGLFSNPTFAFSAQFPEGGGRSNIQASLAQNIVDLWQIPIRKRAAERSLDESILRLARAAAQLCIDTKIAYYAAVAADQNLDIARENYDIVKRLLDVALARQKAGFVSELDVNLNRQTVLTAQLEVQQARLDAAAARRQLALLLGVTTRVEDVALTTPLSEAPLVWWTTDELLEVAREHRLDLRAARKSAEAAAVRLEFEYRKIFPDFNIGAALERNERRALPGRDVLADTARASIANGALTAPDIQSRGQRNQERRQEIDAILGPAFSLTLPIFDQNQAQIARARFTFEQTLKQVEALERGIVQETRQSLDAATTAAEIARFYEQSLLPQSQSNLELTRTSYEKGATPILVVLDAQRSLLAARRGAVTARQAASTSLAELERVTAQPLRALPTSMPASQPASLPEGF
ncbi:MAG: hypothetical protein DCC65_16410 [Planctomycetota bacterium]|nr:MAG: hypothetical protein DCC65_16410 [Planctomycetota bacterium]